MFLNDGARADGDPGPDVHPVRQAVPHLPAAGEPGGRVLQAGGAPKVRSRRAPRCGEPFASVTADVDLKDVLPQVGFDYATPERRQLPGPLPRVAAVGWSRSRNRDGSEGSADGPPSARPTSSSSPGTDPHLNEAPPGGWNAGVDPRPRGADPLLLLRSAVRDHPQGQGRRGRRLRALVRVPLQRGQALPEGREALPPERAPRPVSSNPSSGTPPTPAVSVRSPGTTPSTAPSPRSGASRRAHGNDAFAMLSGVSLDNEKSYLIGKFARLALGTANLDYNGRLCMVSAGVANKRALGIDRASNPWSDIPLAEVVFVAGANVAECAPDHHELHLAGPRQRRQADRRRPAGHTRWRGRPTCSSGCGRAPTPRCSARSCTCSSTATGSTTTFIDAHTEGFEAAAEAVAEATRRRGRREVTGVPAARIEQAAEWWGTSRTGMLLHARGIEHHTKGVENVLVGINLGLATGKYGKPGCGVSTITGQGNGQGGREHGHKCDQLPGNRDITNPEHRGYIAVGVGLRGRRHPGQGHHRAGDRRGDPPRRDQGLAVDLLQPRRVAPGHGVHGGGARPARVLRRHRLLPVRDARSTPTSCCRARCTRRTKARRRASRAASSSSTRRSAARQRTARLGDPLRPRRAASAKGRYFPYTNRREIFEELRVASKGGSADYAGITWERIEDELGVFWPCPSEDHPGTPRPVRRRSVLHRQRAGEVQPGALPAARPRWSTTSTRCGSPPGRVVSQYLSGTQTRRIGPLVAQYPEPLCEIHPRLAEEHGIADGDVVRVTSRRGSMTLPAHGRRTIRPDTVFIPYHWAGPPRRQPAHQPGARPALQDPRVQGVGGAGRAGRPAGATAIVDERDLGLHVGRVRCDA